MVQAASIRQPPGLLSTVASLPDMWIAVSLASLGHKGAGFRHQQIMPFRESDKDRPSRLRVNITDQGRPTGLQRQLAGRVMLISPFHENLVGVHDRIDLGWDIEP